MNISSEEFKARRKITKRNVERLKKQPIRKRSVVWLYPITIERQYRRELMRVINEWLKDVDGLLEIYLPAIFTELEKTVVKTDSSIDFFEPLFNRINSRLSSHTENFIVIAKNTAKKTNAWNKKQFLKVLHSITGLKILSSDLWVDNVVNSFVNRNVNLIKNLASELTGKINHLVHNGVVLGKSIRTIKKEIVNTGIEGGAFRSVKKRAELIARDQVGKLNGQMSMNRQKSIGVKKYIWRTALDERVRSAHSAREGKTYSWKNPPADGHPGMPIQCRCYPEPDLTEVLSF
jgi:SPP1 gp7 family putative phage head morphogenesis protein